ncbi:type IV pilus modification protein PilV [Lampropedia puyangensis]|nr:type IV pilus modification protein PilV [Lampropedia puyangensis]
MLKLHSPSPRTPQSGFALIEVLVSILVLSIGLLGAAGMFTRGIDFTVDTERRQMAAMVANEWMETMRGNTATILNANGTPKEDLGGYAKNSSTDVDSESCDPTSVEAAKQLNCWAARSIELMPELDDAFIKTHFSVTQNSGVISVQVAWPSKSKQCLADDETVNDNTYCTYTIHSKL